MYLHFLREIKQAPKLVLLVSLGGRVLGEVCFLLLSILTTFVVLSLLKGALGTSLVVQG